MDKIYVGKISGYHGIKGELKIVSDFEKKEMVFIKNFEVIIDNEKKIITSSRVHKNNYLITLNSLFDLNLVDKYIGKDIFINKRNLRLGENDYLLGDLIDFSVYDEEVLLGKVVDLMYNKNNNFLCVMGETKFYIPLIKEYIKKVDVENKKIETINGKDLII